MLFVTGAPRRGDDPARGLGNHRRTMLTLGHGTLSHDSSHVLRPALHRAYSAVTLGVRCDGGQSRRAPGLAGGSLECKRTATRPPQTRKAAPADSAGAAVVPRGSSYGSRGAVGGPVTTESPCIEDVG